jgi:hypothetical protein
VIHSIVAPAVSAWRLQASSRRLSRFLKGGSPLSVHAELGGTMRHLKCGMFISSELIQIW